MFMETSKNLRTPDVQRASKILRQVEFYLSEGNLNRDSFFRQEMDKREDSGIPIALLLKCNRMIAMNVTEDMLRKVVKSSKILKVSNDGTAIVRVLPLTELGPREKRTILVTELPRSPVGISMHGDEDNSSQKNMESDDVNNASNLSWEFSDWIRNTFEEFGEVLYVNLPRYHKSDSFRGFAFVEFKTSKSARKAVKHINSTIENEQWLVKPTEAPESSECPASAWKPRLAAKASFSFEQMLARRYVWRCCSRKNKQLIAAFKHLRQAGYTAVNPCDKEYYSIILGDSSTESILNYVRDASHCEPCRTKLRVFRYSDWIFWKEKFYLWQQAWIARMRRKTSELFLESDNMNHDHDASMEENGVSCDAAVVDAEISESSLQTQQTQTSPKPKSLPKDYVLKSVVQIYWPSNLVSTGGHKTQQTINDNFLCDDSLLAPKRLSFARCLRVSLEKNLLVPNDLLRFVAHVDPNPDQSLLDSVNQFGSCICINPNVNASSSSSPPSDDELYPLFIRMKSAEAAEKLLQCLRSSSSSQLHGVMTRILEGRSEQAYCESIVKSKVTAAERHRISQAKKRQKQKSQNKSLPPAPAPPPPPTVSSTFCTPLIKNDSKHIRFDE
uniref:La-related protein 7 n=1 Tax=Trichobilharzia regenti TaxID=157069 RepID=A0AA85K9C3_TRIRE|nr:unnamed protein product [Trichobilharzia regenti]